MLLDFFPSLSLAPSFSYATNNFAQILFLRFFSLYSSINFPSQVSYYDFSILSFFRCPFLPPSVHVLPLSPLCNAMQYIHISGMVRISFCYIQIPVVVYIGRKESDERGVVMKYPSQKDTGQENPLFQQKFSIGFSLQSCPSPSLSTTILTLLFYSYFSSSSLHNISPFSISR